MFESILVARSADNRLSFVDLSSLPDISVLGEVTPSQNYSDYALVGNSLYLSHWFEGISEYQLLEFNSLSHLKTDSTGVLMTQLEHQNGYLYALDMYNGLIQYDLNADFGSKVNKLLVKQRPFAFSLVDSLIFVTLNSQGLLRGHFNNENGNVIDSLPGITSPVKLFNTESNLILLSERKATVLSKENYHLTAEFPIESHSAKGDLITIGGQQSLILPKENGGITRFSLDEAQNEQELLSRPGPISTTIVNFSKIITGGSNNPLERYEIGEVGLVNAGIISDNYPGITDAVIHSSNLFALSSNRNVVEIFARDQNSYYLLDSFIIETGSQTISVISTVASPDLIVIIAGKDFISKYEISAGSYELTTNWKFDSPISSFAVVANRIYVADRFGVLTIYESLDDNVLSECFKKQLNGTAWKLLSNENSVMVFVHNTMAIYDGCNSTDSLIMLALPVLDAIVQNDTLYTVGSKGVAVYEFTDFYPVQLHSSNLRGSRISADRGLVATTDGSAIFIYHLSSDSTISGSGIRELKSSARLFDNYPEPFNSSTNIQYELTRESNVRLTVYNLLGQQVTTLVSSVKPSGKHIVNWDGRNQSGKAVTSGVYFYRLETAEIILSKKMLLLK